MSGQEKLNKGRGDFLENCTIAELEALLNAAVQDIPEDEAYIAGLEAAILRCETECPTGRLSEPDEAWKQFRSTRLDGGINRFGLSNDAKVLKTFLSMEGECQPHRPLRLGRALLIAAVIVVMMTLLLPPVLGYRDIFHMVAQWTDGQFRFVAPAYGSPETFEEDNAQKAITPLMESLEEHGLPLSFAPSWIPEDRQLIEVQFRESEREEVYYTAVFADENEERVIFFDIIKAINPSSSVWEKDDNEVIEFPCNGIIHYIIKNNGLVSAIWSVGPFEISVGGHISVEEAKAIVKSIYER